MEIYEQLRIIRESMNLKQSDLATKNHIKQQVISRIERGENITMNTLKTYANSLGQDLSLTPQPSIYFKNSYLYRIYEKILNNANEPIILSHIAAADLLGLFSGYTNEYIVEYYASIDYKVNNTLCHICSNKKELGYTSVNNILCTDVNRTINDLLLDYDRIDDGPILEALNHYYFTHDNSFDSLLISKKALDILSEYQKDAIEYS